MPTQTRRLSEIPFLCLVDIWFTYCYPSLVYSSLLLSTTYSLLSKVCLAFLDNNKKNDCFKRKEADYLTVLNEEIWKASIGLVLPGCSGRPCLWLFLILSGTPLLGWYWDTLPFLPLSSHNAYSAVSLLPPFISQRQFLIPLLTTEKFRDVNSVREDSSNCRRREPLVDS